MNAHESHGFGHSEFCYWCGLNEDDADIEMRCDEREHTKPSEEAMAAFESRMDVGETIGNIAFEYGVEIIDWDEMMKRIQALRPRAETPLVEKKGTDSK